MDQRKILILTIVLGLIGLFGALQVIELRAEEPRRAVVSMEMEMSGNYLVPHINGVEYYNKPPVYNWIMAAVFKITNSYEEWAVRLPGLLSIVVLSLLSFLFAKPQLGRQKAIWASIFLITGADILFYGSVNSGEIDLFYALLTFLQLILIYHYYERAQWWPLFLITYALAAIGFLTKGMPSLAFQGITLLAWFSYKGSFRKLLSIQHLTGILLMTLIIGGYFLLYNQHSDAWSFLIRQFKEASQRTASEASLMQVMRQIFSFPFQFMVLLLPWSLFLIPWFKKGRRKEIVGNSLLSFSLLFIMTNVLIYWFAGEFKARYYYMFFPFVCYFLAYSAEEALQSKGWRTVLQILGSLVALFAVSSVLLYTDSWHLTRLLTLVALIVTVALFTALIWKSPYIVLSLAALLFLARIGFNYGILSATQRKADKFYREEVAQLMQICNGKQVHLYGTAYEFTSDASIGPLRLDSASFRTAPLIAYQIPYYISKASEEIMLFDEELISGRYYLVPAELMQQEWEPLFSLRDHWQQRDYHLIQSP